MPKMTTNVFRRKGKEKNNSNGNDEKKILSRDDEKNKL